MKHTLGSIVALLVYALMAAFAVPAQAASPAQPASTACTADKPVLKDVSNKSLPGNPSLACADGLTPSAVVVGDETLRLYANGAAPYPLTNFGGIKRECDKLMPQGGACFTTNPYETSLTESAICGYPAVPAYVLACDASGCVSEIYSQACGSTYPPLSTGQLYSAPATPLNVGGVINDGADFGRQGFASRLDFTGNLNTAERIVSQGRTPVLGLGALLMGDDGALRPTAAQDLSAAIAKYPLVFNAPGLTIGVYDEPFWGIDRATLPVRINGIKKSIALLRSLVPAASLGVVVAPTWSSEPLMVASLEAILSDLQWVATDTYAQSLDTPSFERVLSLARHFSNYMKIAHPSMGRWLVIQGFAPVSSPLPTQWLPAQFDLFEQFLSSLVDVANAGYDGVVVWGWSNAYELPDAYTGKFFPPALKQLYLNKSLGQ